MAQNLATVTLLVRDYDEALAFLTGSLGFRVVEDTPLGGGKRWVVVAPPSSGSASLLLARAATPEQLKSLGNQAGAYFSFFTRTIFGGTIARCKPPM